MRVDILDAAILPSHKRNQGNTYPRVLALDLTTPSSDCPLRLGDSRGCLSVASVWCLAICYGVNVKHPRRLRCLQIWSPAGGAIWGKLWTFRTQGLVGGLVTKERLPLQCEQLLQPLLL